jgi:hypothetical protein
MPPTDAQVTAGLEMPASVAQTLGFAQAVAARAAGARIGPALTEQGRPLASAGRDAAAFAQALSARAPAAPTQFRLSWLLDLFKRYQPHLWAGASPALYYFRWLRRQAEETSAAAAETGPTARALARPARTGERAPSAAGGVTRIERVYLERDGVRAAPDREPLRAGLLNSANRLPSAFSLQTATAAAFVSSARWTDSARMRLAKPDILADAVARRVEAPGCGAQPAIPFREAASLPMPLSYPPVPLASWLGVAAAAPEQAAREHAAAFTRPQFHP